MSLCAWELLLTHTKKRFKVISYCPYRDPRNSARRMGTSLLPNPNLPITLIQRYGLETDVAEYLSKCFVEHLGTLFNVFWPKQ